MNTFASLFSALPSDPKAYPPFPAAAERTLWDALPQEARTPLIERGDAALLLPWPRLGAADYLDFTRTGRRTLFEGKYFARRHTLNDLVMAECAAGQKRYIDAIADYVWELCEESGWQLPAHNTYIRDTPARPLPDISRPVLDLFACETGAALALTYHLLGPELEGTAPGIGARILGELGTRLLSPYLNGHFWWMGNGDEPMCNWTPWCTQNVLLAAALTPQPDQLRRLVCEKAAASLDCFVKDYGEDGCCDEGAKYYGHAALCLFTATEVLNGMTGGHFAPLYKTERVRNMADFIRQMHVAGNYYINFADCPPVLEVQGELVFLFGEKTENPGLSAFAAVLVRERRLYEPCADLSLYTRLAALFSAGEISRHSIEAEKPEDRYFESAGLLIARDERTCLAVKTGDNNDNHNHNDTGSITLYLDGKPFLIDVGVGSYTRETFSHERYSIWTMQSAYHNLPTFAGVMQEAGADYKATGIEYHIGNDETYICMDIAAAYPEKAGVLRYLRTVCLKKGKGVFISDVYDGKHPASLSLLLDRRPHIDGQTIEVPGRGRISVSGAGHIGVEHIPVTDPVLRKAWPDSLYRLLIEFSRKLELEILAADQL